jgi:hypothetical protein
MKNLPVSIAMHLTKGTRSEVCCKLRRVFLMGNGFGTLLVAEQHGNRHQI